MRVVLCDLLSLQFWALRKERRSGEIGQGIFHQVVIKRGSAFVQCPRFSSWRETLTERDRPKVPNVCCQNDFLYGNTDESASYRKLTQHLPYPLVIERLSKHFNRTFEVRRLCLSYTSVPILIHIKQDDDMDPETVVGHFDKHLSNGSSSEGGDR